MFPIIMVVLVAGGGALELLLHRAAARRQSTQQWFRSSSGPAQVAPRTSGERLAGSLGVALLSCFGGVTLTWQAAGAPSAPALCCWAVLACAITAVWYALSASDARRLTAGPSQRPPTGGRASAGQRDAGMESRPWR